MQEIIVFRAVGIERDAACKPDANQILACRSGFSSVFVVGLAQTCRRADRDRLDGDGKSDINVRSKRANHRDS